MAMSWIWSVCVCVWRVCDRSTVSGFALYGPGLGLDTAGGQSVAPRKLHGLGTKFRPECTFTH